MQTARRATASIANPGYRHIPVLGFFNYRSLGRCAVVRFLSEHHITNAKVVTEHPLEMLKETFVPSLPLDIKPTVMPASELSRGATLTSTG